MTILTTEQLQTKLAQKLPDFYLIDVLAVASYTARHIPGARSVPKGADFIERFEKEVGASKDAEIAVYCSSDACMASVQMGEMLEAAGYTNVAHYKDGLAGWQQANLPFETGA